MFIKIQKFQNEACCILFSNYEAYFLQRVFPYLEHRNDTKFVTIFGFGHGVRPRMRPMSRTRERAASLCRMRVSSLRTASMRGFTTGFNFSGSAASPRETTALATAPNVLHKRHKHFE
jgi:hypothetical protein